MTVGTASSISWVDIVTLVAAVGAVAASLWAVKKAGITKLAEFRRDWIEDLRTHLSSFRSLYLTCRTLLTDLQNTKGEEASLDLRESYRNSLTSLRYEHSYINMMLNSKESLHSAMLQKLTRMAEKALGDTSENQERDDLEFDKLARDILKKEWKRVREAI